MGLTRHLSAGTRSVDDGDLSECPLPPTVCPNEPPIISGAAWIRVLATSVSTAETPYLFDRFATEIGESHWKRRVPAIKAEIKGNSYLRQHLLRRDAIAIRLAHLSDLRNTFGTISVSEWNNRLNYAALAFAAQALSVLDSMPKDLGNQFRQRVRGAFKNEDDMRALRLELMVATHFLLRGGVVKWPEMGGGGTFDLYVENLGSGLEVECKSISQDKGKKVHEREVLDFYNDLSPHLQSTRRGLRTGLFAVITLPDRLPPQYRDRLKLAKDVGVQIFKGRSGALSDGSELRISEFDTSSLPSLPPDGQISPVLRAEIDRITRTNNRQSLILGTGAGGLLVVTVQSAKDDSVMSALFATLRDSAGHQFSRDRAAMFSVGFDGLDEAQLLSVARQDQDRTQAPTALRIAVSRFLNSSGRDHIVGVAFFSESALQPVGEGLVTSGGIVYYFPNPGSRHWSEAFSGLFAASASNG